jgi:hypothetical protein
VATNYDSWSGFSAGTNINGNGYTRRGSNNSGTPTVTADASGDYEDDLYVALTSSASNPITPDAAGSVTGLQQSYVRARPQAITNHVVSAYVRVAASGDTMYGCGLTSSGGTLVIYRLNVGSYTQLGSSVSVTPFAVDDLVHLLFEVDDSESNAVLRAKYWRNAESVPVSWTSSHTDTSPLSQGYPGFGQRQQTSEARFDVFSWGTGETAALTAGSSALATPANFSFTAHGSLRQLNGSWTAVANAGSYEASVDYETDPDTWVNLTTYAGAATSFQLTDADGVAWGTKYRCRVRAIPA